MSPREWFLFSAALIAIPASLPAADVRPNFVIFLADDLGWGELGCQGCIDIPTPHIDSLAAAGVRCTNGYVSGPYCSPTRAGLLTGRYQTRFGHEWNPGGARKDAGLPLTETTLPQRLKELGYATCAVGKWHLGEAPQFRPTRRGFDEFFGTLANTPYYHPTLFVDSRISDEVRPVEDPEFYTTDAYAERAADWIGAHAEQPFCLYLPFNAQHAPLQAPSRYTDRFPNITDSKRKTFAGMMAAMDDAVGRVLSTLRAHQLEESTLVFFLGDNGGPTPSTTSHNGPLRGQKMTTSEGGVRVPFVVQWKGRIPAGKVYDQPLIQLDILPTCLVAAGGTVDPQWQLDGVDLIPYLTDQQQGAPHETLYWRMGPQWAIRHGDWKLVASRVDDNQPRLVNLSQDLSESHDLSANEPQKRAELQALYDAWNAQQAAPLWQPRPNQPAGKAAKNPRRTAGGKGRRKAARTQAPDSAP